MTYAGLLAAELYTDGTLETPAYLQGPKVQTVSTVNSQAKRTEQAVFSYLLIC